jgi:hypothetical protein
MRKKRAGQINEAGGITSCVVARLGSGPHVAIEYGILAMIGCFGSQLQLTITRAGIKFRSRKHLLTIILGIAGADVFTRPTSNAQPESMVREQEARNSTCGVVSCRSIRDGAFKNYQGT